MPLDLGRATLSMITVQTTSAFLFAIVALSGCVSPKPYTEPGIQPPEAKLMKSAYYWSPRTDPSLFTDAQIESLFGRSIEMEFSDGERSELYTSELVWAIAAAGDAHFAALLSRQPHSIQQSVLRNMESLWRHDGLHYPLTESLADE